MQNLENKNILVVNQKVEFFEALSGFETNNKYQILSENGENLYLAAEESNFLLRLLLKKFRPFKINIISKDGLKKLTLNSPFRFFFKEIKINDSNNNYLGKIQRNFTFFTKDLTVYDNNNNIICDITAPFFHPWTFTIKKNNQEIGLISKKFSGISKEFFTDADNFSIKFPDNADLNLKKILLGALFLIDIIYFEN